MFYELSVVFSAKDCYPLTQSSNLICVTACSNGERVGLRVESCGNGKAETKYWFQVAAFPRHNLTNSFCMLLIAPEILMAESFDDEDKE